MTVVEVVVIVLIVVIVVETTTAVSRIVEVLVKVAVRVNKPKLISQHNH